MVNTLSAWCRVFGIFWGNRNDLIYTYNHIRNETESKFRPLGKGDGGRFLVLSTPLNKRLLTLFENNSPAFHNYIDDRKWIFGGVK